MDEMTVGEVRNTIVDIFTTNDIDLEEIPENDYESYKSSGLARRKDKFAALKELEYIDVGEYICAKVEINQNGDCVVYLASFDWTLRIDDEELYVDYE